MTLKLTQKTAVLDGKNIAYVKATIIEGNYSYDVMFDKNTKKRFNAFCVSKGFKVGVVDDVSTVPERILDIT